MKPEIILPEAIRNRAEVPIFRNARAPSKQVVTSGAMMSDG